VNKDYIGDRAWITALAIHTGNVFLPLAKTPRTEKPAVGSRIGRGKTQRVARSKRRYCAPSEDRYRWEFLCASWPWPWTCWPQNKWVSRTHGGTFLCQVWWSGLHRFLRYLAQKQTDKQTDKRININAAENPINHRIAALRKLDIQGGPKKWYFSCITLHCTRGITFFGPPCRLLHVRNT